MAITRSSVTNERDLDKERTMGRKHIVPYGLYRMHGFINAKLAEKTGFSETDLDLLWEAIEHMFEFDRSAARGEMAVRKLSCSAMTARSATHPPTGCSRPSPCSARAAATCCRRETIACTTRRRRGAFSDYAVRVDTEGLPDGVELTERV